jgi:hypothetical protein
MPVQGLVKLRKHQFGWQGTAMNTAVPAQRAYPFSGVPSVDEQWTDPEIDAGSIDPVAPPYRLAGDYTASLDDPALKYNNLPLMLAAALAETVAPTTTGTSEAWHWAPSSTTVEERDVFTYEFGDDVVTDWYQLSDGLLETLEITGSRDPDGPLTASMSWRFGTMQQTGSTDNPVTGTVPTPDLNVALTDIMVYLKDGAIYIASDPDDLSTSQISDALHAFTLRITNTYDLKRYANGEQTFNIDAYALSDRMIELECRFAKTDDTVGTGSESDAWLSNDSVVRYIQMIFTSTAEADTAIPYSWQFTMPARYYTREEDAIGGNTIIVLTAHAFYDGEDLEEVFDTDVVNTIDETAI